MGDFIVLKQNSGEVITAKDDRILYDLSHTSGVINGCMCVGEGVLIRVMAGYGVIKGALFEIKEHYVGVPQGVYTSAQKGQLILKVDYSKEDPVSIVCDVGTERRALVQDENCNFNGGIYEIRLCQFEVSTRGEAVNVFSTSQKALRFGITEDGQYGYYKAGADSVTPFKSGSGIKETIINAGSSATGNCYAYYYIDRDVSKLSWELLNTSDSSRGTLSNVLLVPIDPVTNTAISGKSNVTLTKGESGTAIIPEECRGNDYFFRMARTSSKSIILKITVE